MKDYAFLCLLCGLYFYPKMGSCILRKECVKFFYVPQQNETAPTEKHTVHHGGWYTYCKFLFALTDTVSSHQVPICRCRWMSEECERMSKVDIDRITQLTPTFAATTSDTGPPSLAVLSIIGVSAIGGVR